ncbi:hypothetical protein C8Q76DRAFT_860643 [Earliella scabrosa]|nr:hypothetical protein C8Q76DRAFT_860643 [Earliella scabrosa]
MPETASFRSMQSREDVTRASRLDTFDNAINNLLALKCTLEGGRRRNMTVSDDHNMTEPPSFSSADIIIRDNARTKRTGTHYHIAIELLSSKTPVVHATRHDLESFHWVLLWILLRHASHNLGEAFWKTIFVSGGSDWAGAAHKSFWIICHDDELTLSANAPPLTTLVEDFRELVKVAYVDKTRSLAYDSVLGIFRKAVETPGWPEDDFSVRCTLLDTTGGTVVIGAGPMTPTAREAQLYEADKGVEVGVPNEEGEVVEDSQTEIAPSPGHADDVLPHSDPTQVDATVREDANGEESYAGPTTRARAKRQLAALAQAAEPIQVTEAGPSDGSSASKRRRLNARASGRTHPKHMGNAIRKRQGRARKT